MLLFRLSEGISSGCHHANNTHQLFSELSVWGKRHYASASTWPGYLFRMNYGTTTAKIIFGSVIIEVRGNKLPLRLSQGISSGCQTCHTCIIFLNLSLVWERGIMLRLRISEDIFHGAVFYAST